MSMAWLGVVMLVIGAGAAVVIGAEALGSRLANRGRDPRSPCGAGEY